MNIFIDTQDMKERYGEQLYQDYLVEQNKNLQQRINKAIEYTTSLREKYFRNCVCGSNNDLSELIEILKGELSE